MSARARPGETARLRSTNLLLRYRPRRIACVPAGSSSGSDGARSRSSTEVRSVHVVIWWLGDAQSPLLSRATASAEN